MTDIPIEDLIPHRRAMRLVDKIVSVDEDTAVTESTVTVDWPLATDDGATPLALIELVAQTAAVSIGWKEVYQKENTGGNKGWLVGIKKADFFVDHLPINARITTQVRKGFHFENYHEITGNAEIEGDRVCDIVLQVFWAEEEGKSDPKNSEFRSQKPE